MGKRLEKSRCKSGKVPYKNQGAALRAIEVIHRQNAQAVAALPFEPQSAYHCDCGAWHLTKQKGGVRAGV
jgi:hypothetical protein